LKNGLYASMWNRQREAEEARERLARIDEDKGAPNRNPPPVDDPVLARTAAPDVPAAAE
jgi:ATP-binding cassette subfamily B protein